MVTYADVQVVATALGRLHLPQHSARSSSQCSSSSQESLARKLGAGDGNRTHVSSLGSCSSTIELHPRGDLILRVRRRLPQCWASIMPLHETGTEPAAGDSRDACCAHRCR